MIIQLDPDAAKLSGVCWATSQRGSRAWLEWAPKANRALVEIIYPALVTAHNLLCYTGTGLDAYVYMQDLYL